MVYLVKTTLAHIHIIWIVKFSGFRKSKGHIFSHARNLFAVLKFYDVLVWISVNIGLGHSRFGS
jgi:hypothetical protein